MIGLFVYSLFACNIIDNTCKPRLVVGSKISIVAKIIFLLAGIGLLWVANSVGMIAVYVVVYSVIALLVGAVVVFDIQIIRLDSKDVLYIDSKKQYNTKLRDIKDKLGLDKAKAARRARSIQSLAILQGLLCFNIESVLHNLGVESASRFVADVGALHIGLISTVLLVVVGAVVVALYASLLRGSSISRKYRLLYMSSVVGSAVLFVILHNVVESVFVWMYVVLLIGLVYAYAYNLLLALSTKDKYKDSDNTNYDKVAAQAQ